MKAAILLLAMFSLLVMIDSPVLAQAEKDLKKSEVPKNVISSFEKSYPKAKASGYSTETENGSTTYEVESTEGKIHRDVTFDPQGTVISVEESMESQDLPPVVQGAFKKGYPKAKILKCEKVVERGVMTYELLVRSGKKKTELVYSPEGNLVKSEKK